MKILAIETSCDETAISLVEAKGGLNPPVGGPRFKILKNFVSSQIEIHRPFGGIVPNLAKREHLRNLPLLFKKIQDSRFKIQNINLIAVTVGPGLEPALWTGINFAKEIYKSIRHQVSGIKLIGVSHLEGHLYSNILENVGIKNLFPAIALLISGGHTILIKMDSLVKYKKLGETRDDAVGEAFDKVARLLDLPYPGGPEIEKLAKYGSSTSIDFPRPMLNQKNYDFSFSGLKTAVLYYLKNKLEAKNLFRASMSKEIVINYRSEREGNRNVSERSETHFGGLPEASEDNLSIAKTAGEKRFLADVAASFQQAAFDVLISKTLRAAEEFNVKSIMISGGVAANKILQKKFKSKIKSQMPDVKFFTPVKNFCTDNAAMIAAAGYVNYLRNKKRKLTAKGNLSL